MELIPKNSIVCTIGPVSSNEETIKALAEAGMTVVRTNMSHETHDGQTQKIVMIRKVAPQVKILGDLCGPKLRVGKILGDYMELVPGEECVLTTEVIEGAPKRFSINYDKFHEEVAPGMKVYLHDGKKVLEVIKIEGNDVHCKVIIGGNLKSYKGMNVPEANLSISPITDKDKEDIAFLVKEKVDMIGLSFVRSAEHVQELKDILKKEGLMIPIISKIETPQALRNIESIIEASDGIMVARGDLGVEIGLELVPKWQKEIIALCNKVDKPVIVATEMMKSMTYEEVPTRAEVSDVANAILDGATAVMTSGETALGKHPVETVKWMKKIIEVYKK